MMIFPSLQHSCLSLTANDLLFIHAVVFMLPCIAIFLIVIDELGHIHSILTCLHMIICVVSSVRVSD